jgi:hypothetical protein
VGGYAPKSLVNLLFDSRVGLPKLAAAESGEPLRNIESSIDIDAPPEKVWAILMDFDAYPDWNPFITRIKGEQAVGGKLEAYLSLSEGKGMTFKPTVKVFEDGTELTWLGIMFVPHVFDGRHTLRVEPREGGSTFVHRESFSGLLAGLMMRFIGESTENGFRAMNEALKARVEDG